MLSFLHTPPSSPLDNKQMVQRHGIFKSSSPEYIPIKQETYTAQSPESENEHGGTLATGKRRAEDTLEKPRVKVTKLEDVEDEKYSECRKLFDNPEDVVQALTLLRTRKNVDIKNYSHEGTFIPNVLLALSQTPRLTPRKPTLTEARQPTLTEARKPTLNESTKPCRPRSECGRPYVCEYCGKQFSNIGNLATHARTHTKEKPYKCSKCDLEFAHTSNLQRHQLVHSGQRNNKCPHCSKCFSRSDYLKVHERTHTGEKPYACTVEGCSKRFLDSSSLKKHERTHTGDRPFACHICYKTYTESSKLKVHLQTHKTIQDGTPQHKTRACPKAQHQQRGKENSGVNYPTVTTQTIPNPLYPSALQPTYPYLTPSIYQPIPKPTPTRPTPTRVMYHPYSRATMSQAVPPHNMPTLVPMSFPSSLPVSMVAAQRSSAFLPFPV